MALIIVMEDDAATRMLVSSVLRKEGHQVLAAENGEQGLALVDAQVPDLIVSDVQMPGMNGFQMLNMLRSDVQLSRVPVILLTSLQERAHMRIGMTSGADDYITKPFQPRELREAVAAQLNKRKVQQVLQGMAVDTAVSNALSEQAEKLMKLYEERLAAELSDRWPASTTGESDERFDSATVLFADIPAYAGLAEKLSTDELTGLVRRFYAHANDTASLFGARYMQFIGQGLLAVFTNEANTETVNHALRAVRTALALVDSAKGMERHLQATLSGRGLPAFTAAVALNSGPVTLTLLRDALHGGTQQLPVGDVTTGALQLQKQVQAQGWSIAASVSTLRAVTGAVRIGRRALIDLPGRSQPMDAAELLGLQLQGE